MTNENMNNQNNTNRADYVGEGAAESRHDAVAAHPAQTQNLGSEPTAQEPAPSEVGTEQLSGERAYQVEQPRTPVNPYGAPAQSVAPETPVNPYGRQDQPQRGFSFGSATGTAEVASFVGENASANASADANARGGVSGAPEVAENAATMHIPSVQSYPLASTESSAAATSAAVSSGPAATGTAPQAADTASQQFAGTGYGYGAAPQEFGDSQQAATGVSYGYGQAQSQAGQVPPRVSAQFLAQDQGVRGSENAYQAENAHSSENAYFGGVQQEPAASQQMVQTIYAPEKKKKFQLGVLPVAALMLASAVGAGGITGVALTQGGGAGTVYTSFDQPVIHQAKDATPGSVEQVAAAVLPSVVSIRVVTPTGADEGSGSIISSDGMVLTNNHVIADALNNPQAQLTVTLHNGDTHPADVIAGDGSTDIAVIKIRDVAGLPVINFGNSDDLNVGQQVVAIGSPLGLSATVTSGIVSALNRPVRASGGNGGESSLIDAVQTDAAINPGNSGGPLVDMNGNLIGMNSVIASMSSGSETAGSIGLGFAIPVNQARRIADQLINTGVVSQPKIGVRVDPRANVAGAEIVSVEEDSPASRAGLQPGDVVTKLNDRVIDTSDALIAAVRSQDFGATVTLQVMDPQGETRDVEVTLTQN